MPSASVLNAKPMHRPPPWTEPAMLKEGTAGAPHRSAIGSGDLNILQKRVDDRHRDDVPGELSVLISTGTSHPQELTVRKKDRTTRTAWTHARLNLQGGGMHLRLGEG